MMAAVSAVFVGLMPADGHAISVAASIAPIQSLVMGVMGSAGQPALLIPGGQSPHTFALRPSTARAIEHARVVFRIGPNYEAALNAALASAPRRTLVVNLIDAPGVVLYPARDVDELGLVTGSRDHLTDDPHIWLDPDNARAIARAIARTLSEADPLHERDYVDNEAVVEQWTLALDKAIRTEIAPVKGRPFIVFHDGYQYFERHYGLHFAGAVTEMPGREPGAAHIHKVRAEIEAAHVPCVFSEPQFEPRLIATITEGLRVRVGILDMLGAGMKPSPYLYFDVMRGLSQSMVQCLS
ncbi:MAG TPA: zinc ABC transporter substrate-binding protein [Alphaproteobacteria bacterium]|nr:zinc ABC transporter substrate-binding protein [Alphaproteobacteria bacterium]